MSARDVLAAQYAEAKRARADARRLLGSLSKLGSASMLHVEHRAKVRVVEELLNQEVRYLAQRLGRANVEVHTEE